MIPEHNRLAQILFLPVPFRNPKSRSAFRDFIIFYINDSRVVYQVILRPILGYYLVPSYGLEIQK
jgi:hypothetical protein